MAPELRPAGSNVGYNGRFLQGTCWVMLPHPQPLGKIPRKWLKPRPRQTGNKDVTLVLANFWGLEEFELSSRHLRPCWEALRPEHEKKEVGLGRPAVPLPHRAFQPLTPEPYLYLGGRLKEGLESPGTDNPRVTRHFGLLEKGLG